MGCEALDGVRVVECGHLAAAPYCAKLLADLGADVVKVEEPGHGDPARQRGPFYHDVPDPEGSGLFLYLNTNKRSITLDLRTATGQGVLRELVDGTDVLIEDYPPKEADLWGLQFDPLHSVNPQLIMLSLTPFGQTGPHRDYKAYPLNTFHSGGEGYLLPSGWPWALFPDREPIKAAAFAGECNIGLSAAIAVMTALFAREFAGQGQHIDMSKQEALLALVRGEIMRYADEGVVETRGNRWLPLGGIMPCADGFVQVQPLEDHMWRALVKIMGDPDWSKDARFQTRQDRVLHRQELYPLIIEWLKDKRKEDIYHQLQRAGCAAAAYYDPADVIASPQVQAREFFVSVGHPRTGNVLYPSAPYKLPDSPWSVRRPAPLLGQHNEEVYCRLLGHSPEEIVGWRKAGII